ncbi:hypothetical protein FDA94_28605 [Herbidospora galbida]|uniref:Uncharacterized protein n=1 Tax=Herbidospora galbida TaxID=2575442 RepID=A0A4V5UYH8_9ACTN|nr:hypothetical protein [Herbidospora galbida]TKK84593.1 hypothetical protein FDA94_28605 [Herbidospora galbida]
MLASELKTRVQEIVLEAITEPYICGCCDGSYETTNEIFEVVRDWLGIKLAAAEADSEKDFEFLYDVNLLRQLLDELG